MIRYALICHDCESNFEAWFASSDAYDKQVAAGQLTCVQCHGQNVEKQVMAPSVSGTKSQAKPDPQNTFGKLAAAAREHISENYDYVGDGFAGEAKAMFYGDTDQRPIWGETTSEERAELEDEGVPATPLHPAFAPKKPHGDKKLN